MSSYLTHMAIGAAGGLALAHAAPGLVPGPAEIAAPALALVSAVAATWPDIDVAGSWASNRAVPTLTYLGAFVGLLAVPHEGLVEATATAGLGALVGCAGGYALLAAIRALSGGHRAGTHSLFALALLIIAGSLASACDIGAWALLPALLAWGWALHIVGDIVTPAGWRPFAPLTDETVRLPRWASRHGETAALAVALAGIAAALGLPWLLAIAALPVVIVVTGGRAKGGRGWRGR